MVLLILILSLSKRSTSIIDECLLFVVIAIVPPLKKGNSDCSVGPARIMLISMLGHQDTEIRDRTPANAAISDSQNQRHSNVTLYENSVNVLRMQLDCGQQPRDELVNDSCSLTYHINVWIDLNDDGTLDDFENRVIHRSLVSSQGQRGLYDLEVCVPAIDGTHTKAGRHRMHLSLMPNEDYRRACGSVDYRETREYTVHVIPKATCEGKIYSLILLSE